MKSSLGTGLGLAGGGLGLVITFLLFLGREAFELEVGTPVLGDLSAGIAGVLVLIFSMVIIIGTLLARSRPGLSALMLISAGAAGLILLGALFVLQAVLVLVAAAIIFAKGRTASDQQKGAV